MSCSPNDVIQGKCPRIIGRLVTFCWHLRWVPSTWGRIIHRPDDMWSFSSCWMMYNCSTYLLRTYKVKSCSCIIRAQAQDTPSNMHGFASTISNVSGATPRTPWQEGRPPPVPTSLLPMLWPSAPNIFPKFTLMVCSSKISNKHC